MFGAFSRVHIGHVHLEGELFVEVVVLGDGVGLTESGGLGLMRFGGGAIASTWESVGGMESELEEISASFRLRFGSVSDILFSCNWEEGQ